LTQTVLARVAALKGMPIATLKQQWRDLFGNEPPRYNRLERLEAIADELDRNGNLGRFRHARDMPIAGTQLIREWQGVEHRVKVCDDGFEYEGMPYKSLSAIARRIAGTRWNGWVFFGLKNQRAGT
jgi:hypothetical protein